MLLGEIGGVPFYMGAAQFEYWRHTQLIIDVVPGRGAASHSRRPRGSNPSRDGFSGIAQSPWKRLDASSPSKNLKKRLPVIWKGRFRMLSPKVRNRDDLEHRHDHGDEE